MKAHEFLFSIVAISIGTLIGMLAWTLIVKSQVAAALADGKTSTLGTLLGILGSK